MLVNMETPSKLATSVINDFKQGSESIINACLKISQAWQACDADGAWSEEKFISFIDRISEAGIGPGRDVFFPKYKNQEVVFQKSPKAGAYYQMKSVGECSVFHTKEFRSLSRITAYSVLYRLSVLHNEIFKNTTGSESNKLDKADKAVFGILRKFGSDLTRDEVNKAISKIGKRKSRAPKQIDDYAENKELASNVGSLQEIISAEHQYDLILITPSEKILDDVSDYSLSTLMDKAPYEQLMSSKSKTVLLGKGRHFEGLKKLSRTAGELDRIYCLRSSSQKNTLIDLTDELIVITNFNLDLSTSLKSGEQPQDFIKRAIVEKDNSGKNLHLFATESSEGWVSIHPDSSFIDS